MNRLNETDPCNVSQNFMNRNKRISLTEKSAYETLQHMASNNKVDAEGLNLALVVDGFSLNHILNDELSRIYFAMITCITSAVICYRVSPL